MSLSYESTIKKLHSKEMFYIETGLDRISAVLKEFGNPENNLKYIHVAGTNGKGSVCTILDSILREAGFKTGLYTSPHIYEYTERIKISGVEISKKIFSEYFEKIYNKTKELKIYLTEFEILTVIMFLYFNDNQVDIVILETGLGGRLDATNVIKENLCSIITKIDLDHTDKLGNTKEQIAYEKAGIIKSNSTVITSESYEVIKDTADKLNSMFILVSPSVDKKFIDALSLKGLHQTENLSLALTAINYVFPEINEELILKALPKVNNPYRFQYFKDKNLIVDASHNPNGIKALRENLDYYFPDIKRRFVFGCLNTKDYKQMIEILFKEDDEIYFNEFDYPNACTYEELNNACMYKTNRYTKSLNLDDDKLNIICGSFYMIGKMKF
ncbi:MAG: bifunctional folylpolyglutamate synthase/dihydrofolate synthase [bacterium]|nr:bifunctional folylpolyglutamate synthase/dihydrofolate synthase [bacterium]